MSTGSDQHFAFVRVQNIGPIAEGEFHVRPLTLFTGRNNVGKTITSALLYILQKSIWNALQARRRPLAAQILAARRKSFPLESIAQIEIDLNAAFKNGEFLADLKEGFVEELARVFSGQKNIIGHGRQKARFVVEHSAGWKFDCEIRSNAVTCSLSTGKLRFEGTGLNSTSSLTIQRELSTSFAGAFAGWDDRPIMIPAGRAGITDSYRYLAEQVLLERHGYRKGGPSGITRDFLALLVGAGERQGLLEEEDELPHVASLFDPMLGGLLRPSDNPEELFTFSVHGKEIDRNVMSSMVKELGPMVVMLQTSKVDGSVLIIDEPECHLHPKAQVELASAFVSLVSRKARFVLSTHSPYLAQSLSNQWVVQARAGIVGIENMSVVNFADGPNGIIARDIPLSEQYGFTFDDFAQTANEVQDRFVGLFE